MRRQRVVWAEDGTAHLVPRTVTVAGRRWYDGTNTYHSVAVYADGVFTGGNGFSYGYDRQYEETGLEVLIAAGVLPNLRYPSNGFPLGLGRTCSDLRVALVNEVADVARRGDLHWSGRSSGGVFVGSPWEVYA